MKNNPCDVIIVGAGLAGLNAARKLKNAGFTVKILEARDRVGGRNLGHHLEDGKVLEKCHIRKKTIYGMNSDQ